MTVQRKKCVLELFGISLNPQKIDAYVKDFKEIVKSIEEKIRKKEVYKASSSETQIQFLKKICQQSENLPVTEKPLIEVTGLCEKLN